MRFYQSVEYFKQS